MDYNARMSQQFRQTQTGRHGASAGVGKQTKARKEEADDPMRLDDREIAGCISDVGMPGFGVEDLQQPAPALIQRVFEWFAELLTNTTRETVEPAMREAARDVCGDDMLDLVPPDARNLLGFFASLRKILVKCGIDDLTFADLLRPTYPRLVRIFSYIINFVRFREDQTSAIDQHFGLVESTKHGIETLYASNTELQSRLEHLRLERVNQESANREKTARNSALKERLLELKKAQEKVALDMERVRRTKAELTASLAVKTERTLSLQKECDRLSPYASQSSAALQAQLNELSAALAREKALAEAASRRHRALHTSSAAFSAAAGDVAALLPLLDATYAAAADERAEELEAQKRREALGERGQDVREVERTEALLARQLAGWVERTRELRERERERGERDRERMEGLRGEYEGLARERGERGREVERKRVRVEKMEKKMADLKENIEAEIHAAHDKYQKMEAHIRLYITEMDQALVF